MWLEDLIEIAEQEASCELWGVLKREDEKYVTERAENPKFVEDLVRDVAARHCRSGRRSVESASGRSTTTRRTPASTSTRTPRSLVGPVGIEPTTERL